MRVNSCRSVTALSSWRFFADSMTLKWKAMSRMLNCSVSAGMAAAVRPAASLASCSSRKASLSGAKLPIFFGGESGPALRRVAEYGNGWCGFNLTPAEATAKIKRIEEMLKANGRKRSDVELAVSPYTKPCTADDLKRYRDAGVDEVVLIRLRPPRAEDEVVRDIEQIAREWVEPASRL